MSVATVMMSARLPLAPGAAISHVRPGTPSAKDCGPCRATVSSVRAVWAAVVHNARRVHGLGVQSEMATIECDLAIYGATPGGIFAAVTAARYGRSVTLCATDRNVEAWWGTQGLSALSADGRKATFADPANVEVVEFYPEALKKIADGAQAPRTALQEAATRDLDILDRSTPRQARPAPGAGGAGTGGTVGTGGAVWAGGGMRKGTPCSSLWKRCCISAERAARSSSG
jgi:hypothetical protein